MAKKTKEQLLLNKIDYIMKDLQIAKRELKKGTLINQEYFNKMKNKIDSLSKTIKK